MSVNEVQQTANQYRTSTNTYTNNDGLLEKEQVVTNKSNGRIIKKSVWVDKDNSGTFDKGELTSVTIFGYTEDGKYGKSETFFDNDGDGYRDERLTIGEYTKQSNGEYKKVEHNLSLSPVERIERKANDEMLSEESRNEYKQELEKAKMCNINETSKQYSKTISDILEFYASNGINPF